MKYPIQLSFIILGLLINAHTTHADLTLKVADSKNYGKKIIVKIDLQNTFTNTIESARAVMFILDDNGKVVGQETRWIVGGTKDRPPLAPDAKTTFNFVVQSDKPFTKTKVTVTRIVLEGGKLADVSKDVQIKSAKDQTYYLNPATGQTITIKNQPEVSAHVGQNPSGGWTQLIPFSH